MAVVKVIEVISEGKTIDEAMKAAIDEVSKTVENITQINVEHIHGLVEDKKIKKIRINSKVSFIKKQ